VTEIVLATTIGVLVGGVLFAALIGPAAYRNGVTDGYGYAKEPGCPGYRHAGEYLRSHMAHRWPDLTRKYVGSRVPPKGGSGTAPARLYDREGATNPKT
jgi:hypothetical protein